MRVLHTSDWHLGRRLYGRNRYDEFADFLSWLLDLVNEQAIDVLLVAGDVFDTSTPSHRAQELYYDFLARLTRSRCRHVVIVAGNHDSPSFLDAPRALLQSFRIHVIGTPLSPAADECLVLTGPDDRPQAIVCAVPYLRDKDIRTVEEGETLADKERKLITGLRDHYAAVCAAAEQQRQATGLAAELPLIATGHLFTAGGQTIEDDGVRELYVGTLAHIQPDAFPDNIDYLALGHLHVPQRVGGQDRLRYSGSPLPMGYGELASPKQVNIIDFAGRRPQIREVTVPCFQELERISGSLTDIIDQLDELVATRSTAWVEIEYTGEANIPNLRDAIMEHVTGSQLEIRRVKNRRLTRQILSRINEAEELDDLDVQTIFSRCLDSNQIPPETRDELSLLYHEILQAIYTADPNAL